MGRLVQQFYNERRKQVLAAVPNDAHLQLAQLEEYFDVQIITQNIDDLHERAGSTEVMHLHGVITLSQSDANASLVYLIKGDELKMGSLCELGSQLLPHVAVFEDIFLEDPKKYRENQFYKIGMETIFPLWKRNIFDLVKEFIA